jgi:hypothetical protein
MLECKIYQEKSATYRIQCSVNLLHLGCFLVLLFDQDFSMDGSVGIYQRVVMMFKADLRKSGMKVVE